MKVSMVYKYGLALLFFFGLSQRGSTQKNVLPIFKPHFYGAINTIIYRDYTEVEENPLFTEGYLGTADLGIMAGYQINKAISVEFAYQNRGLTISNSFGVNNSTRVTGIADMNTLSMSINNAIPVIHNRLFLKPKVGYVAGWHSLAENYATSGSSSTTIMGDLSTSNRYEILRGGRLDFLLLGLGLEVNVTKRISILVGYLRQQGFKELARADLEYEYLEEKGEVQSITYGSIAGAEFSLKYRFK